MCLANALSVLLQRPEESMCEQFKALRPDPPWTDADLMVVAHKNGVHLMPFFFSFASVKYGYACKMLDIYDGILCESIPGQVGHAIAKIGSHVPDRVLQGLTDWVFFAWTNKP
jgi:hypothetical protein